MLSFAARYLTCLAVLWAIGRVTRWLLRWLLRWNMLRANRAARVRRRGENLVEFEEAGLEFETRLLYVARRHRLPRTERRQAVGKEAVSGQQPISTEDF